MGLAKNRLTPVISVEEVNKLPSVQEAKAESGTSAAVERLKKSKPVIDTRENGNYGKAAYKPRDFDAEARGKTRCVQFEAALMSPAIAGMKFDTMEQYLALVKQAAEAGVAYTFGA